jgi:hypothetical protein
MANITVLEAAAHADLRATGGGNAGWSIDRHFVEIVPRELALVAITCPVLLTKNADTGAFMLGAVLGVEPGENLYSDQMNADDAYRPLQMQRDGFWIAGDQLAADLDHPRFGYGAGEALFDPDGAPTSFLAGVAEALRELRGGGPMTTAFVKALVTLELLAPVDIELSFDDGSRRMLEDLYSIDQDRLRALDDAAVLDLFRRGYLNLVYLMIGSLKNIPRLAKRKNARLGLLA